MPASNRKESRESSDHAPGPAIVVRQLCKQFRRGRWEGDLRDDVKAWFERFLGSSHIDQPGYALRNIDLCIERGESVCLLGPNGAGKTTLLRLFAGISLPSSGCVSIAGRVVPLIELGAGFHRELSGEENAYLFGAVLGLSDEELRARLPEIFRFAELDEQRTLPLKHFSSGMQARLALAVGLLADGDVLLLDEVMGVSDMGFRAKCVEELKRLQRAGKTLVFVSHERGLVSSLCSRALLLVNGELVEQGPLADVLSSYQERVERGQPEVDGASVIDGVRLVEVQTHWAEHQGHPTFVLEAVLTLAKPCSPDVVVSVRRGDVTLTSTSLRSSRSVVFDAGATYLVRLRLSHLEVLCGQYEMSFHLASDGKRLERVFSLALPETPGSVGPITLQPEWEVHRSSRVD